MAGWSNKAVAEGESRTQSESGFKGDLEKRAHRESGLVMRDLMRVSLEQGRAEASRVARVKGKELLERQEARLTIEGKRQVALMKLRAEISEQTVQVLEEEQRKAVKAYGEEQAEWGEAVRNYVQAMHKKKEDLAVMEAVQRLELKDILAEMREVRAARSQWEEQERNRKEENLAIGVLKEEFSFELRERKGAVVVAAVSEEDAVGQKNEVEEEVAEVVVLEKPKDKPVQIDMSIETQGTGNEKPAEKAVGVSEPAASSRLVEEVEDEKSECLDRKEEEFIDIQEEEVGVEEVEDEEVGSLDRKEEEFVVDILDYELGFLVVEKEEEECSEFDFEEEICITEEKVRRLVVVDIGEEDFSVVGRTEARLEAYQHPVVGFCHLCIDVVSSTKHRKDGVPGAAMIGRKDQLSGVRRYWRNKRTRVKEKEGDSCRLEWMQQSSLRSRYQDATEGGCCYQSWGRCGVRTPQRRRF